MQTCVGRVLAVTSNGPATPASVVMEATRRAILHVHIHADRLMAQLLGPTVVFPHALHEVMPATFLHLGHQSKRVRSNSGYALIVGHEGYTMHWASHVRSHGMRLKQLFHAKQGGSG